jgi:hypothetical protein
MIKSLFLTEFREILKKINSKRGKKKVTPQKVKKINDITQYLSTIKAKQLKLNKLPTEKGFFGKKIEKLLTLHLLGGNLLTSDFGPSDINKKFLQDFINSGKLLDGHLQIKASKTNSFSTADLFYFLESSQLNMLLIKYKVNTLNRSFKIIEVWNVQLNSLFFEHIMDINSKMLGSLAEKSDPFKNTSKNINKKKNKLIKKKLKFFSFSHKKTRWQGNLNIVSLKEFLQQNKNCGYVEKIEINHNDSSFTFCDICIKPLILSY